MKTSVPLIEKEQHSKQLLKQRIIATTDTVSDRVRKFNNINTCSTYTFTNHSSWVGDGTGIEVEELEENTYISELDD